MFNYNGGPSWTPYLDAMRAEAVKMAAYGQSYPYIDKRAAVGQAIGSRLKRVGNGLLGVGFFSNLPTHVGTYTGGFFGGYPGTIAGGTAGGALAGGLYGGLTGALRDDSTFWTGAGRGALTGAGIGAAGGAALVGINKFRPNMSDKYFPEVVGALGLGTTAANIAAASPLGDRVFGPAQDPWYTRQGIQDRLSAYYGTNPYLY